MAENKYLTYYLRKEKEKENLPIVILDGKPWGLKTMSGTIPLSVNGRSSEGQPLLNIPF